MKKKLIAVLLACGLLSSTASAQITIQHHPETGSCTVSGTFAQPDMTVNLQILQQGVTEAELQSADYTQPDAVSNLILAAFQLKTDRDGEIQTEFNLDAGMGIYQFRYRSTAGGEAGSGSFYYTDLATLDALVSDINAAATGQEICSILEKDAEVCGMDLAFYKTLSTAGKERVGAGLLGKAFADFASLNQAFLLGVADASLAFQTDETVLAAMFRQYAGLMQLSDMPGYELYDGMNEKQMGEFMAHIISDNQVASLEALKLRFQEYAVLAVLYGAEAWAETEQIVKEYAGLLRVDLTVYNSLKSKSSVLKQLVGKHFDNASAFRTYFNQIVKDQAERERGNGSSGSTGGGGASSGGIGGFGGGYIDSLPEITPQPSEEPQPGLEPVFSDLESVGWAADSIELLAKEGIVKGKENGKFCPQDCITREEYLKLLVESLGLKDNSAVYEFSDVPPEAWYYIYVASGVKHGITNGVTEFEFGTGQPISRQDMAVMTIRALQCRQITLPSINEKKQFEDTIAAYAIEAVTALQQAGVINGISETEFAPERMSTRAEAAKIVCGVLQSAGLL